MPNQTIDDLITLYERFNEEKINMKSYMDELTTNGAGLLYELRNIISDDTELAQSINKIGTSVMAAKENAFSSLDQISEVLNEKIENAQIEAQKANTEYSEQNSQVSSVNFISENN